MCISFQMVLSLYNKNIKLFGPKHNKWRSSVFSTLVCHRKIIEMLRVQWTKNGNL